MSAVGTAALKTPWALAERDLLLGNLKQFMERASGRARAKGYKPLRGEDNAARSAVDLIDQRRSDGRDAVGPLHYTYAMHICRLCGSGKDARRLLAAMDADQRLPSAEMYGAALWAHTRELDVTGAKEVWKEMRRLGVAPNAECYGGLMATIAREADAAERCSDATRARLLKAFRGMIEDSLYPTRMHYAALIRHAKDPAAALELFRYCRAEGFALDRGLSTGLVRFYRRHCSRAGADPRAAVAEFLAVMEESSLSLTSAQVAGVLEIYRTHGCHDDAEAFWEAQAGAGKEQELLTPQVCLELLNIAHAEIEGLRAAIDGADEAGRAAPLARMHAVRTRSMDRFAMCHAQGSLRSHPRLWHAMLRVQTASGDHEGARNLLRHISGEGVSYNAAINEEAAGLGVAPLVGVPAMQVESHLTTPGGTVPGKWWSNARQPA